MPSHSLFQTPKFAKIRASNTIEELVDVIPVETTERYLPVVDGAAPAITDPNGSIISAAMDRWTVGPTQVTILYEQVIPSAAVIANRAAKTAAQTAARNAKAILTGHNAGGTPERLNLLETTVATLVDILLP